MSNRQSHLAPEFLPALEHQSESHTNNIYALTSTPLYIISGSKDSSIRIWSKKTRRLAFPPLLGHQSAVAAIEAADAAGLIFSGDGKGNVMIWDLEAGTLLQSIEQAHTDCVLGVAFESGSLVTVSRDQSVKVWERESGTSPLFATVAHEAVFTATTKATFRLRHTLLGHQGAVLSVRVVKSGTRAITFGGDRTLKIWYVQSGQLFKSFEIPEVAPKFQLIQGESKVLASCTDAGIRIYDLESGAEEVCLYGHGSVVRSVQMIGNEEQAQIIVSASYDSTVRLWKRTNEREEGWSAVHIISFREAVGNVKLFPDDSKRVFDLTVDDAEGYIYACGEAREIVRWKLQL